MVKEEKCTDGCFYTCRNGLIGGTRKSVIASCCELVDLVQRINSVQEKARGFVSREFKRMQVLYNRSQRDVGPLAFWQWDHNLNCCC
jgi:hypothetical protein